MEFTINTSVPIVFEEIESSDDSRFMRVRLYMCHTGLNKNKSIFTKEVIEDAIPSLANIPIVGFIQVNNYNETDFKGHEQRIIIDNDGMSLEYMGKPIGIIPENNNARFEMVEVEGVQKEFLVCDGIIWNKFEQSAEIFDRDEQKGQSMELDKTSVEGKFDKDGVFNFTKFKFEAACALGDHVKPAMAGAVIEKFSISTLEEQFKEMITEFNAYYSQVFSNEVEVLNDTKGGSNMDEKLELFTKFSQLGEEDVSELKENLEQYSVEGLEAKLQEIADAKVEFTEGERPTEETEEEETLATEFSLTASQLRQEIANTLSKEKYKNEWDYESRSFWYIDHDDNRVYCEDVQDKYRAVGMNYTLNGDFVEIDYSTKKPVKFVPVDMEDGVDVNFSMVSEERNQFELTQTKETTETEVTNKFQVVKTELDSTKNKVETLTQENQELLEFKLNIEKTEKHNKIETLFSKFDDLTEEDVQGLREKQDDMSLEVLELNLYALRGKKQESVKDLKKAKDKKEENIMFSLTDSMNTPPSDVSKPEWAEIVDQYDNK